LNKSTVAAMTRYTFDKQETWNRRQSFTPKRQLLRLIAHQPIQYDQRRPIKISLNYLQENHERNQSKLFGSMTKTLIPCKFKHTLELILGFKYNTFIFCIFVIDVLTENNGFLKP
jgi:hypothetical protein